MLVCSVSLQVPRTISADIAEIAAAATNATGHIVASFGDIIERAEATDTTAAEGNIFPGLVDDPASAGDIVDAVLGEIMVEPASATDTITVGSEFIATIVESVTAVSLEDGTIPLVSTSWNPADIHNITLSNGNLTATSGTGGAGFAGVRAVSGKSSGKYYFEITTTTFSAAYVGLAKSTNNLTGNTTDAVALNAGGTILVNGAVISGVGTIGLGGGAIVGIAVDLTNSLIWFRVGASGSWNALSGSANNPATGIGGVNISTIAATLFPMFSTASSSSQNVTANFGASAFNGAVPSGFTSGW